MNQRRIVVVDDDPQLQETIGLMLQHEGYAVSAALSGSEGIEQVESSAPDLVILDINLPDISGFDVVRILRRSSPLPILMLTGRTESSDVVSGLDSGADDYLTKPFHADELLARVRALLRRVPELSQPLVVGDGQVEIDLRARRVRVRGEPVELTPTEYQLLLLLAQHAGQVLDHQTLLRHVWGEEVSDDSAYLKVYIWHLRRKLELNPSEPRIVLTEWGVGYRLAP